MTASNPGAQPGDRARATVTVAVSAEEAFALFTSEINQWWRRGVRFRNAPGESGMIHMEPGVGGRVFESFDVNGTETVVEIGRALCWEPARRLVFSWRNGNFAPDEATEVEVTFEEIASGTRVTVEHRGWSALRQDHPAKHGLAGLDFAQMIGRWWGDQLAVFRLRVADRTGG